MGPEQGCKITRDGGRHLEFIIGGATGQQGGLNQCEGGAAVGQQVSVTEPNRTGSAELAGITGENYLKSFSRPCLNKKDVYLCAG